MNEDPPAEQAPAGGSQPAATPISAAPTATPPLAAAPKIERRAAQRLPFRVPVQVHFSNGQLFEAKSMDLSTSGIGLVADVNPGQSGNVTISFTLMQRNGSALPAKTRAEIAYCVLSRDGFKIGLQFLNPPAALKTALQTFCHG